MAVASQKMILQRANDQVRAVVCERDCVCAYYENLMCQSMQPMPNLLHFHPSTQRRALSLTKSSSLIECVEPWRQLPRGNFPSRRFPRQHRQSIIQDQMLHRTRQTRRGTCASIPQPNPDCKIRLYKSLTMTWWFWINITSSSRRRRSWWWYWIANYCREQPNSHNCK